MCAPLHSGIVPVMCRFAGVIVAGILIIVVYVCWVGTDSIVRKCVAVAIRREINSVFSVIFDHVIVDVVRIGTDDPDAVVIVRAYLVLVYLVFGGTIQR